MSLGQPVKVYVQVRKTHRGVILPRESVVRSAGGETVIWERVSPERFVARTIRLRPIDGKSVVVLAGNEPDVQIVTVGAGLLNQVR